MQLFIDQFMNGVGAGVVYASVALALVIIYRTTGLLNFAQGEMALFSTFLCWWFTEQGIGIVLALILAVVASFIGGGLIERVLIRPVEGPTKNPLNVVIVTLGMFIAINALCGLLFLSESAEGNQMPLLFPEGKVFGVQKQIIGSALVLAAESVALWFLLQKTKVGLKLRAVASNPESAKLVGINPNTMLMLGWAIAASIGAVGGVLAVSRGSGGFNTSSMQAILVYSFAAAALGGFDSPVGAIVGGLFVGIANSLTVEYVDSLDGITIVVPFVLIFIVLLVRPNGLFGRTVVERV